MKWKLSISKKYAFYVSALSLVLLTVILISVSIIVWREANTLKERLREGVKEPYEKSYKTMIINRSRSFSYVIFNPLYRLDINGINHLIKNLKAEMPIKSVLIADASGKVLTDGTAENPSFETILNADFPILKSRQSFLIRTAEGHVVTFIIALGDHIAGYGEILFLDDPLKSAVQQQDEIVFSMWKETQRRFRGIALIGVLSILFFTVFLGLLFSRRLSFQLLKLRDATKKVAKGDLHCRLEVQSRDELGDLADSFNQMAEELLVTTVSKDYMDNIIKNMNDSLIVVSPDGTIKTVNQATLDLLGYTQDELSNQPFGIIFEEENLASEGARLNDLMKEGSLSVRNIEKTYLSKDGRKIPVLLSGSVMRDGDGEIQGIVYVALDITERKQAEEELRKHREHLEELVKNRTIELTETNKQLQEEIDERNWAEESLIRSEEEARLLAQENAIMAEIGRIINSTLNIEEVYERFAEEVRKLIPSDRISISINNPEDSTVTIAYVTGVEIGDRRQGDTIPLTSSINKEIIRTRSGLLIQTEEEGELINRFPLLLTSFQAGFRSMMSVPLFSKDEMIGVLHLRSTKPNAYTERDLRIAERVGNQIAGAIANAQLFIERKWAEEALRESEEKYRTILENIEDGYFEVDITGNLTFFNDSLCRMLGYSRDELMGMNNRQYTDTENAKKLYQAFNKVYQTGEPAKAFDWEVIRKDGAKRFGEVSISLIRDSKGQPIGFRGIARDITERKNNDEKILRQSALLDGVNKVLIEALTCQTEEEIANKCLNVAQALTKSKFGFIGEMNQAGRFDTIAMSDPGWEACRIPRSDSVLLINNMEIRGIWASVLKEERSLIVNDPAAHPNRVGTPEGHPLLTSFLGVPLKHMRKTIGMIALANKETVYDSIDQQDIETLCTVFVEALMRKRAEEALRKSEEKFREMYDNAPVGYHEYDTEGRITNVNRTDLEMLGYSREEMIGQLMWEFNVEEEIAHQQIMAKLAGTLPPGKELERIYRRKDGTIFPVLIEDRLILDEKGRIKGIRCTIQDITGIKKTEEALRMSEEEAKRVAQENAIMAEIGRIISSSLEIDKVYEQFGEEVRKAISFDRILINIVNPEVNTFTSAYVMGIDVDGRPPGAVISWSGSATQEIFHSKSSLLIQTENRDELAACYPALLPHFQVGLRSFMAVPLFSKGNVTGVFHLQSTKPDAYTERDLRLAERVGNQIAGAIANAQLFAERVRAEQKAKSLEEQLRQSQKIEAVGRLAGGIAHDFNNLLTVVKGYSELSLLKLKEGDPLKGNIEEIHKASQRAADLTRQLLAFSRRQILEFKTLDLNIILQDMDKMLHRLIGEDIELVTLFAKDIGKVRTDPGQIEQVILNLAVNSRDAMPSGGKLTIETANVELDETHTHTRISITPGRYVMLSVSDTGCGMSPEVKEHLFEPFFTTKEKGKGTGLGLSTIYGIVKQSAGEIWVYSEPGQGTAFKIYLPRVEEEASTLHHGDDKDSLPRGRETVLLVEDELSVRGLAVQVLRENGYNLLEAANGIEALRMAQEYAGEIHLLLTDVVMPQMGGKELADRLKPLRPDIKVLFTSGYTGNAIVHHGVLEPGIDFLQKPFSPAALAQKAREVLDR